jgi:hypothetical protein
MHQQEPTTELTASVDCQRLRATLRLCFAPDVVDALVERVDWQADDTRGALAPLVRSARLIYDSERLRNLLRRSRATAPPLAPRFGLASRSALALALHLGLGLEIEPLAALFGRSAREISLALFEARRAIEPTELEPCPEFVAAIGRYRDPAEERTVERLAFLQHVASCSRCRPALEAARAVDERLLATIEAHERALQPLPKTDRRRSLWFEPTLLWGGAALLLLAALVGGTIGARQLLRSEGPVPLLSAPVASPPFSGWLLQTSVTGAVSAVNLATGERRLVIPGGNNAQTQSILGPDRKQIAQLITTRGDDADVILRAYALDGRLLHEWPHLGQSGQFQLLGWLDAHTILISSPPGGAPRELEHSTLHAFDLSNGTQRSLFDGWVDSALASPDGQYLAVDVALTNGTSTLQIRPVVSGSLGAPVATDSAGGGEPFAWTKDGRIIFWTRTNSGSTINSLALDGTVTQLYQSAIGFIPTMLGLSPDGTRLIYTTTDNPGAGPWSYWQMILPAGTTQKLTDGGKGFGLPSNVVWSPDGDALMLTLNEPFYMPHPAQTGSATSIASYRVVAFDSSGKSRGSLLDQFDNQSLLAWLPEAALPNQASLETIDAAHSDRFTSAGLLDLGGPRPQLTNDSTLSPDGSAALVYGPTYDFAMALTPIGGNFQSAGLPSDPSWLPDSSGSIGVQHHGAKSGQISRIAVYGDIGTPGRSVTDFDPAELGDSTTAAYRYPMLAPDGLHNSFFVRDRQTVTLWIGGEQEPPRTVASWQIPNGAKIDPPLIARWIDNTTLIAAEPGNWHNGLPRRVTLQSITLSTGTATTTALVSWRPYGSERGIVLRELRMSSNQTQLALRLRHFTGGDPTKDAFDSITAVATGDLHQSVELARGTLGDGLSWSPDGTQLVAVIQTKLTIFTIQGGRSEQIDSGARSVSYPLWVLPNEIWYQSGSGTSSQMIRAMR